MYLMKNIKVFDYQHLFFKYVIILKNKNIVIDQRSVNKTEVDLMRRCIKCEEIIEDHEVICGMCFIAKLNKEKEQMEKIPELITT